MKPQLSPGDYHLIVNDREDHFESEVKFYNSGGSLISTRPCLAKGQHSDYTRPYGDTPPGLYRLGDLTITQPGESIATWNSFGKYFFDLVEMEGSESKYGRAGVGIHGGGSAAPEPLASFQQLCTTNGCIRFFNKDLETLLYPIFRETQMKSCTIYVTVNQD